MNVLADVDLGNVHTLSGPRLPDHITATINYHSEPRRDLTLLAAVRADENGHRTAWRLDFVMPTESEACFNLKSIDDLGIIVPKAAVRRGDQYCIAVV